MPGHQQNRYGNKIMDLIKVMISKLLLTIDHIAYIPRSTFSIN